MMSTLSRHNEPNVSTLHDIDRVKRCKDNHLVAKKTRGQFSISKVLMAELDRYLAEVNAQGDRLRTVTSTAIIEAGLIAFFEADEPKRQDLLAGAMGLRPLTSLGAKLQETLGQTEPAKGRPAPKAKAGAKG